MVQRRLLVNQDYQKFGREHFERGTDLHRENSPESLSDAFGCFWATYENFLDWMPLKGSTIRERSIAFEEFLMERELHTHFTERVLRLPEAGLLADLQPRVFREQVFQQTGEKKTDEHDAYASDYERIRSGRCPKKPVARLLSLLSVIRNNLQHGQKVLPTDWPEMRERNLQVFSLAAPIQHQIVKNLFETIWAEGVFVYGTLRTLSTRFKMVRSLVKDTTEGYFARGKLYDLGDHPGIILGTGDRVQGEILRSDRLHDLLHRIDDIEGREFTRRLSWVTSNVESSERLLAWIYEYRGESSGFPRCKDGVWPRLVKGMD